MNHTMVKRLILKDWYFSRWPIAGYLAVGAVALALIGTEAKASFYVGSVLLITVLIGLGIHLAQITVVYERTRQTLPFVMTLPISPREYTTAKLLANVLIFIVPWLILLIGTFAVIAQKPALPDGLIPFAAVVLTEIFVGYCLVLAVALVSESEGWTIGAIVLGNLLFQGFLYYVSNIPSIKSTITGSSIIWGPAVLTLLLAELAAIALLLTLTYVFQMRKTDFL